MLVAIRKNNFDQNRIYTALHHGLNSNITFELGYLNSFQRRPVKDFFNRDIIRLSSFHKIAKQKSSPKKSQSGLCLFLSNININWHPEKSQFSNFIL
jgi:hypothetical protein